MFKGPLKRSDKLLGIKRAISIHRERPKKALTAYLKLLEVTVSAELSMPG